MIHILIFWTLALITMILLHFQYRFAIRGETLKTLMPAVIISGITYYFSYNKLLLLVLMYVFIAMWLIVLVSIFKPRNSY